MAWRVTDKAAEAQRAARVEADVEPVSPGLVQYTGELLVQELWLRPALAPRDRSLVTVSALIAAGQVAQMPSHLNRAITSRPCGRIMTSADADRSGWTGRRAAQAFRRCLMRQFIRHPVDVPVEIGTSASGAASAFHTHDISLGGLALLSSFAVPPGANVDIRIPCVQPPFEAHARVAWCQPHDPPGFELGVTFVDAEVAFLARMVEQVCHIEDYRLSVQRLEGRELSPEDAAVEWIAKHAAHFPEIGPSFVH